MLIWTLTLLSLALLAAVLGTGGAGAANQIAWTLVAAFVFGAAVSLLTGRHGSGV